MPMTVSKNKAELSQATSLNAVISTIGQEQHTQAPKLLASWERRPWG